MALTESARHVVLVGLMGSGKSTIGARLARRLGRPFRDSDPSLLRRHGQSARQIGRVHGLPHLHRLEAEVLLDDLASPTPSVIAAAASTADDPACRTALGSSPSIVIWLRGSTALLAERARLGDHRPYEAELDAAIARQSPARAPVWARLADLALDVDALAPDEAVDAIEDHLRHVSE